MSKITIIQGAQWGSEAKGMVAVALAARERFRVAVRTGAINAGHTFYIEGTDQKLEGVGVDGRDLIFKMQQLPAAWPYVTDLALGPGAYIHPPTLQREMGWLKAYAPEVNLRIDSRCCMHGETEEKRAKEANRHISMGAVGKGCSEAVISKLQGRGHALEPEKLDDYNFYQAWRKNKLENFNPYLNLATSFIDVPSWLRYQYGEGNNIMLEGTQGTFLDLHVGPWPYVTSRQTIASAWIAEAGLGPNLNYEVVLVARTYPIRVAGNSGPMVGEISWPELARLQNSRAGYEVIPESAIHSFENACEVIVDRNQDLYPAGSNGTDLHTWNGDEKRKYAHTLSNHYSEVLRYVEERFPADYSELMKLFEFTTVTRKLRRIARLDTGVLRNAVELNTASYVVLTFLNYEFPKVVGLTTWRQVQNACPEVTRYITVMEREIRCPIRFVTTGPRTENMVEIV